MIIQKQIVKENFFFSKIKKLFIDFTQLLNLMMQLRKVCLHPYLFDIENGNFFIYTIYYLLSIYMKNHWNLVNI